MPDLYEKMMTAKVTEKQQASIIAVDIGGSKILATAFTEDGHVLARDIVPTLAKEGVNRVISRVSSAIDKLLEQNITEIDRLGGIGIACAGGVDSERGIVVTPSPNLPDWSNIHLADILRGRFNTNTFIVNDASAAALGESRYGAGKGMKNIVLLTVGTGIGGGIIINGELYLGARGGAGEIGHMSIDINGPECGCGNLGCLEMMASGKAVTREAVNRIKHGEKSMMVEMVEEKIDNITMETIGIAAHSGDDLAKDIMDRGAYYLGVGIVNLVNIFNADMVIIGGGMSELGEMLIGPSRRMVKERAFSISSQSVRIVTAELGNEAGVYGAAAFVQDKIRKVK
jgi:glucokinase